MGMNIYSSGSISLLKYTITDKLLKKYNELLKQVWKAESNFHSNFSIDEKNNMFVCLKASDSGAGLFGSVHSLTRVDELLKILKAFYKQMDPKDRKFFEPDGTIFYKDSWLNTYRGIIYIDYPYYTDDDGDKCKIPSDTKTNELLQIVEIRIEEYNNEHHKTAYTTTTKYSLLEIKNLSISKT